MRDGALDRNGNGMGWKWPIVKRDTLVFLVKQINRINRLSIILGGFFHFTGASTFVIMTCFTTHCSILIETTMAGKGTRESDMSIATMDLKWIRKSFDFLDFPTNSDSTYLVEKCPPSQKPFRDYKGHAA